MDDLFDFSGGAESIAAGSKHRRREPNNTNTPSSSSKPPNESRWVDEEMKDGDASDASDEEGLNGPRSSSRPRKRARKHEPAPVVLDEFETQAKRELPVNAGLSASVEVDGGQSLLLTHQVSQRAVIVAEYHLTQRFPG
jgi:hypothetical protein